MKTKIVFFLFPFALLVLSLPNGLPLIFPTFVLAVPAPITGTPLGNIGGLGPLGTIIEKLTATDVTPASNAFASIISMIIGLITVITGLWFMIKILIAGFTIISSSGDKNKMQEAQSAITNSIIGLTVAVAAYALTSLFGKILGIPNILNVGNIIESLGPK